MAWRRVRGSEHAKAAEFCGLLSKTLEGVPTEKGKQFTLLRKARTALYGSGISASGWAKGGYLAERDILRRPVEKNKETLDKDDTYSTLRAILEERFELRKTVPVL